MVRTFLIRKLSAGILLLVFALSITPTQVLHKFFANHKDTYSSLSKKDSRVPQLHKSGINCQCLNLVVQNPYLSHFNNIHFQNILFVTSRLFIYDASFYSASQLLSSLRGPPSLI